MRAAHPEFPYALHCLSMMCALVNGARVAVFPTSQSPLVAINVNYAQTRKSSMTGHAETLGQALDAVILKQWNQDWKRACQSRQCKMDCQVGLPEGFEGRAYIYIYTFFVDEMFDPSNALTLCKGTTNLMTVCMTTFLCPCPLSAQVFAAKSTISYSGQLHARRMVSSLLRRLGPSPERGQVAR